MGSVESIGDAIGHVVTQMAVSVCKGNACPVGSQTQLIAGLGVLAITDSDGQILGDLFDGCLCKKLGAGVSALSSDGLAGVGKGIQTGVGSDGGGNRMGQLGSTIARCCA